MKYLKTQKIIPFLTLFLSLIFLLGIEVAAKDSEVEISVSYGIDNHIRLDGKDSIDIRVDIRNTGEEEFNGVAELKESQFNVQDSGRIIKDNEEDFSNGSEHKAKMYLLQQEISMKEKDTRQIIFTVPSSIAKHPMELCLIKDGEEIISRNIWIEDENVIYIGILEAFEGEYEYDSQLDGGASVFELSGFTTKRLVSEEEELGNYDFLIYPANDMTQLNDEEMDVLIRWVNKGGNLILNSTSGEELKKRIDLGIKGEVNVHFSENGIEDRREYMIFELEQSFYGTGIIRIMRQEFFYGFSSKSYLLDELVRWCELKNEKFYPVNSMLVSESDYERILDKVDLKVYVNIYKYIGIVSLYILIMGPILYIILKKKGKRHLLWKVSIILSLTFVVIIYFSSGSSRNITPFIKYLQINRLDGDIMEQSTYMNTSAPYKKPYKLYIRPEYEVVPLITEEMEGSSTWLADKMSRLRVCKKENETEIELSNMPIYSETYFKLYKEEVLKEKQGIETDLTFYEGKMSGSITNNLSVDLENVYIYEKNYLTVIGELPAGETIELVENDAVNTRFQETLEGYRYNFYGSMGKNLSKESMNKDNLFDIGMFILENQMSDRPVLVGTEKQEENGEFQKDWVYQSYGASIYYKELNINYTKGERTFFQKVNTNVGFPNEDSDRGMDLEDMHGVVPGGFILMNYEIDPNLEDYELRIHHVPVSDGMEIQIPKKMYFLNRTTIELDLMVQGKEVFTQEELQPYVDEGDIMIYYTNKDISLLDIDYGDISFQGPRIRLPLVSITGKKVEQ
jgi:hypothetical protein